jgi:CRISPR-associated protein Cst1
MNGNNIKLYPSNWLYNAGVVGLLRVLERNGKWINQKFFKFEESGEVIINIDELISNEEEIECDSKKFRISKLGFYWLLESWEQLVDKKEGKDSDKKSSEKIKEVWGKLFNTWYRGFFNANTEYLFKPPKRSKESKELIYQLDCFLKSFDGENFDGENICSFCSRKFNFAYKNVFTSEHSKFLGASKGVRGVPNSFWNFNPELYICNFCSFVLLNCHLAFTPLPDDSEIFINAPSFKVMYYLNKYVQSLPKDGKKIKHLLGMSLIEFSTKLKAQLGLWTSMNIEVVIKYKYKKDANKYEDKIDFFSLPAEIVSLLNDHEISSLIYQIGEFKVLDIVLDGKFNKLIEDSYRLMKILMKDQRSKADKEFLKEYFKKNQKDEERKKAVQNMLKLYALIEEKIGRNGLWQARV